MNLEIFNDIRSDILVLKFYNLNNAFCLEVLPEPLISRSLLEFSGGFRLFCFVSVVLTSSVIPDPLIL